MLPRGAPTQDVGHLPRMWGVQQSFVEQAMLNQSGVSQATRGLREKAMAQAKGTACAKAQG